MQKRVSVRGIAVLDGKLLCVQLKPYPGSLQAKEAFWCLPGGGAEDKEPLPDAFRREMQEELGIAPKVGRLLYVYQFAIDGKDVDYLEFFFHIENPEDYRHVDLSKTTHGEKEIEAIGFVDPKTTRILPGFLATEDLEGFIASGERTRFFC